MSTDEGKEKSVLADKQKFGKHEDDEKLEQKAEEKLGHMGGRSPQNPKSGSSGKQ